MKVKVSDYIFEYLKSKNITTAFSVSGGAAAHLLDSAKKSNIQYVANCHEQASAMAAEGYGRISPNPSLVLVTNGPGSSNTITGIVGAYQDSIPVFVLSGQVPRNQTVHTQKDIRQLGIQELDIIKIVDSITKYSFQIQNPKDIKYHLDRAYHECTTGRKGPVWLDIPLDVQSALVETEDLIGLQPILPIYEEPNYQLILELLSKAERPIVVTGNGIHLSKSEEEFKTLVGKLKIPCVSTWTSKDLFDWNDPLFVGNFGLLGERAGNFAVQKADLLLVLGSRLSVANVGYQTKLFSPNSVKIMVDIDEGELNKSTLNIDHKINANLLEFMPNLSRKIPANFPKRQSWIDEVKNWKDKYPVFLPEYKENTEKINSFYLMEVLSDNLEDDHVVVTDMGTSYTCTHQSLKTNGKNRLFTSSGCCSMGFGLPGAIGTFYGDPSKRVVLIAGDGGFQMNIQELQTVVHNNIPLKIFILNNNGYLAISLMQDNLFDSNYVGSTNNSGVSSPDFTKIAKAYGIESVRFANNKELESGITRVLESEGPVLCEVVMPENQPLIPRVQSRKDSSGEIVSTSIENMFPFLPKEELEAVMGKD
jgi:acetolactate synthase-1/2/3 large subunit